jgi:hypothetical protein
MKDYNPGGIKQQRDYRRRQENISKETTDVTEICSCLEKYLTPQHRILNMKLYECVSDITGSSNMLEYISPLLLPFPKSYREG